MSLRYALVRPRRYRPRWFRTRHVRRDGQVLQGSR